MDAEIKTIVDRAVESSETSSEFLQNLLDVETRVEGETGFLSFPVRKHILNRQGSIHGGIVGLAFDMAFGSLHRLTIGPSITVELKIQYIRTASDGMVTCETSFLKRGRSISFLESKLRNDKGELLAAATATLIPAAPK